MTGVQTCALPICFPVTIAYIDFKTIKDSVYDNNIGALTDSLSQMFGKPRVHYRKTEVDLNVDLALD